MDFQVQHKQNFSNEIFKKPQRLASSRTHSILTRTYGENTPKSCLINNNFYQDVENIIRQINPAFKLFVINNSPLNQILNALKEATAVILESKPNEYSSEFSSEYSSFSCEHCGKISESLSKSTLLISQAKENLKRKLKSFKKSKFIQSEKIKEEKKIIDGLKEKLDSLAEKIYSQQDNILSEKKETMKSRFKIETTYFSLNDVKGSGCFGEKFYAKELPIASLENDLDFSSLIEELDSKISIYNSEVGLKEISMKEREIELANKEEEVKKNLHHIEMMNLSLNNSKAQMLELKHDIFPMLDAQSELAKDLLEELQRKIKEATTLLNQFENSPKIKKIDEILELVEELKQKAEEEHQKNCEYTDYLIAMQKELDLYYENKNNELKANGDQLSKLQETVDHTIDLISKKEKQLMDMGESLKERSRVFEKTFESGSFESSRQEGLKNVVSHAKNSNSMCPKTEDFFVFLDSL